MAVWVFVLASLHGVCNAANKCFHACLRVSITCSFSFFFSAWACFHSLFCFCVPLSLPGIPFCISLDPLSLWINYPDLDESSQNVIMSAGCGNLNSSRKEKGGSLCKQARQANKRKKNKLYTRQSQPSQSETVNWGRIFCYILIIPHILHRKSEQFVELYWGFLKLKGWATASHDTDVVRVCSLSEAGCSSHLVLR